MTDTVILGGLLGAGAITRAIADGYVVCDPAPAAITDAHIDVRIGPHSWAPRPTACWDIGHADPRDAYDLCHADDGHIVLRPGVTLCHTIEYIGTTVAWLVPILHTRSTLARWGLSAHQSAGLGDAGYRSRWTLEVHNPHASLVALPVGARVAQVSFLLCQEPGEPYDGRYNAPASDWTPAAMLPRKGNW